MRQVTGAPYSGEHVQESDQPLADGTHLRHSTSTTFYRDSEGRVRSEWTLFPLGPENPESLTMVSISDPVAHALYTLDSINKVVHRQELRVSAPETQPRAAGPSSTVVQPEGNGKPDVVFEKLGAAVREGLTVEGERKTTIRPVGAWQGNDHPLTEVDETWTSPELRIVVFRRRTNPITGEVIGKVTNINRSEPDAALFQPPPDYSVVEEAGELTITWGR
jgi:hypothetical protein